MAQNLACPKKLYTQKQHDAGPLFLVLKLNLQIAPSSYHISKFRKKIILLSKYRHLILVLSSYFQVAKSRLLNISNSLLDVPASFKPLCTNCFCPRLYLVFCSLDPGYKQQATGTKKD